MSIVLEGGCFVSDWRETPTVISGTLSERKVIGKSTGAQAISLRVLEFAQGLSPGLRATDSDDVLYFLESPNNSVDYACDIFVNGRMHRVAPQTGIYLRPGETLTVHNQSKIPAVFVSCQCPESSTSVIVDSMTEPATAIKDCDTPLIRLADREAIPTADRWYRVLVDDEIGSEQVTQFIGSIPPGRAPDHFHTYEEVLFILRGEGRMWAGQTSTPIGPGSCIYLPKRQVHCVENTGTGELRLLGVFYPAGSPAVRYEA
jgi:mannose-6-phosphate isomerase-like protein (cupin superfamily)